MAGLSIIVGIVKYFFTPLIALFAISMVRSEKQISQLINCYIIIIFIAALTIPLQFIIGPISWFAESATRGGAYRFSTLLGNLTAIGISGGMGLTMALFFKRSNNFIYIMIILGISIGMLMSMQRAGIINFLLAFMIYFFGSGGSFTRKLKLLFFLSTLFILAYYFAMKIEFSKIYLSFFLNSLGLDSGIQTRVDYDPFYEQIIYRLVGNVLTHFNYYGFIWLSVGYGFSGLGGILGLKGLYAHNDFLNMLTVGGLIYFLFLSFFSP